jgi:hypothetical protein
VAVENYFNYFTEIEECFQQCRQTKTLLSPLDWALIESWKEQDFPLEAVLAGIGRSFEKFKARPRKYLRVNTLAYCAQEVYRAVEEARSNESQGGAHRADNVPAAFPPEEIVAFLHANADAIEKASRRAREQGGQVLAEDLATAATALGEAAAKEATQPEADLQALERLLTALEDKLTAALTRASSVELLAQFRQEVDRGLVPYRRKMSTTQIESLERQFLKKRLLEHYGIPRLSLFYL